MTSPDPKARPFLRDAQAYLRGATVLHELELGKGNDLTKWETLKPMYFLLLHATELALKSIALARGANPSRSHDIVVLAHKVAQSSDIKNVRAIYKKLRELSEKRVRDKWEGNTDNLSQVACDVELAGVRKKSVGMAACFKTLGALGQSEMKKSEFGKDVSDWWHSARYPRYGTTSYPDFDACVVICEEIIKIGEQESSP